jgi:hypothetical protein
LKSKTSLATIKLSKADIQEFKSLVKADGYKNQTNFFQKVYESYLAIKKAGKKLVYPARLMTEEEEELLRKIQEKNPKP